MRRTPDLPRRRCPDDGACHHACATGCFRVVAAGPLSRVHRDDRWPAEVVTEHGGCTFAADRDPREAAFDTMIVKEGL